MQEPWPQHLAKARRERQELGVQRSLQLWQEPIDLVSNDVLGFARNSFPGSTGGPGATGSRLLGGNSIAAVALEERIAKFHQGEACLLFNSGYAANLGLLGSTPPRKATLLLDEHVHASMREGARLALCPSHRFRHNLLDDLERLLARTQMGMVAVESLYSMGGDVAPLVEMADLCASHGAALVVDEAHTTGVFGTKGEGLCVELGIAHRTFARVYTFGKALGCMGAAVVGSAQLIDHLVNTARSFIYSTALSPQAITAISVAYDRLVSAEGDQARAALQRGIGHYHQLVKDHARFSKNPGAVQWWMPESTELLLRTEAALRKAGIGTKAILAPTVPKGQERIRLVLHSSNTEDEIAAAVRILKAHDTA
jgi:8-amino-7-oxononanoate synthase